MQRRLEVMKRRQERELAQLIQVCIGCGMAGCTEKHRHGCGAAVLNCNEC